MPQDQLEIISPDGTIRFHDLDPARGITNIGRHAENDVVIDSPGVAPFHFVLDHSQKPYRLMMLSDEGEASLDGERLAANAFREMHNWDTLQLDGYTLVLLEATAGPEAAPGLAPPPSVGKRATRPAEGAIVAAAVASARLLAPDLADDVIVTELSGREWVVEVEQTATCELTIVNGGSIVASFEVAVEGLEESWVTLTPPKIYLNEGARAVVAISILAPHASTSSAGLHPFVVVVTSPNHPGRMSRLNARLTLNPYYEFSVGELSPKKQTVSWRKRSGRASLPIVNKGNSEARFRLDGDDDERGCRFEFQVPGEQASLVKQAELRLRPGEETLAIRITPIRRRVIALRSRRYHFTITTALSEGSQVPRAVPGELKSKPLIGPIALLLCLVGLALLLVFLLRPCPAPELASNTPMPDQDQPVTLVYDATRFPDKGPNNLLNNLNRFFLRLTLQYRPAQGEWIVLKQPDELAKPAGTVLDNPAASGTYQLLAESWVSGLIPALKGFTKPVPVYLTPVEPTIVAFAAQPDTILTGQLIVLRWQVTDAETVTLEHDGILETLKDDELQSGQRGFALEKDTTFTLIAGNSSWPTEIRQPVTVKVLIPTPTPLPTPVVLRFDVNPLTIMAGESVRLGWEVTGADVVNIENLGQGLPLKGDVGAQPPASTYYQLTAIKKGPTGEQVQVQSLLQEVIVNPLPTPTAVPVAPQVSLFEATPKEVVAGKSMVVRLTWAVTGQITNVEIASPDIKVTGLSSQDVITVTVNETTLLVLTASNGELKSSKAVEVKAIPPTPTPEPTATPKPTPTPVPPPTPIPKPAISYFSASGQAGYETKVIFKGSETISGEPKYIYEVEAGSMVQLAWQVTGADAVTLDGFGPQPAEAVLDLPLPTRAGVTYWLIAANGGGKTNSYIQIDVTSPPAPPPPVSVSGLEDKAAGTNTIRWSYKPADQDRIDGFRVYRADVEPPTSFAAVATLYRQQSQLVFEWIDTPTPTCGKAYYVVAVYTDLISGQEKETAASENSWYSSPCTP